MGFLALLNRAIPVYHRVEQKGVKMIAATLSPVVFAALFVSCSVGSEEHAATPDMTASPPAQVASSIPETAVALGNDGVLHLIIAGIADTTLPIWWS